MQTLGAREIALGFGTLAALRGQDGRAARTWVAAGLLCDAVDAVVVGIAVTRRAVGRPAGAVVVAVASAAVAGGLAAVRTPSSAPAV